jgi:hypothetical protein
MTQVIKIKRSTANTAPASLANGELAYSAVTGEAHKLFIGRPGGTSGDIDAIGGKYYTDVVDSATNANTVSTLVKRDASGNFSAGTITANLTGDASGNAGTATALATSRDFSVSGDATTASAVSFDGTGNVDLAITLANSGVTSGQYGSNTEVPVITVDSKGRVTALSTSSITTSFDISDGSASDTVSGGETLTFTGGTGVTTTVSANAVTFDIGQDVSTSADVTFNNVTVNGTLSTDDVTAATVTTSGNVVVQGNLTVNGTTTTVNSNEVNIGDAILILNSDETGTPSQNGGIEIERGTSDNVLVVWDETDDRWQFTNNGADYYNIPVPTEYDAYGHWTVSDGSNSTNITSTGTLTFAGTNLTVAESSGTVTYSVAIATTSVKGLASFDTDYFTVTSGAVTLSNVDGGTF